MKHWDDGQKDPEKLVQDEDKTTTINHVRNSLEGCIVFTLPVIKIFVSLEFILEIVQI